jgi:hypothetical protein
VHSWTATRVGDHIWLIGGRCEPPAYVSMLWCVVLVECERARVRVRVLTLAYTGTSAASYYAAGHTRDQTLLARYTITTAVWENMLKRESGKLGTCSVETFDFGKQMDAGMYDTHPELASVPPLFGHTALRVGEGHVSHVYCYHT